MHKGLGDKVKEIIEKTGLDWFVEGKDCGCEGRRSKLNELFPNLKVALTAEQFVRWGEIRTPILLDLSKNILTSTYKERIAKLHAEIFSHKYAMPCNCSPKKWVKFINDIEKVHQLYIKRNDTTTASEISKSKVHKRKRASKPKAKRTTV